MAESAQIGLPEISIGNFLGGGVTWLLPRLVGLAKARELVFLGERIKGDEAVRIGLANRVFADEGFLDAAREFARKVASKAPFSMQLAKEQLNLSAERTLDACLTAELEGMMFVDDEGLAGGDDAFAETRTRSSRGDDTEPRHTTPAPATTHKSALHDFLAPDSIVIVGASADPTSAATRPSSASSRATTAKYPLNPKVPEILGVPTYASLDDIPGPVEPGADLHPGRDPARPAGRLRRGGRRVR